jgi:hypothetical protein
MWLLQLVPVASGFIRDATSSSHRLNGARQMVRDGNYLYVAANVDDSITIVIDIETPTTPTQVSRITNNATTILLDGATGIFKSGNYLYTTVYLQNALQIIQVNGRYTTNPTIINTTSIAYTWALSTITETPGASHSGTLKYQLSKNGGTTWYWFNGTSWVTTTWGYTNSSTMAQIQANIATFDALPGTGNLKIKTFLNSNGTQRSEIDQITIDTITDSIAPVISSAFPGTGALLPIGNQSFTFTYSDSDSWVNITSDILELRKWDGVSAFGANIAATHINFAGKSVTATWATYPILSDIAYGRYEFTFKISDNAGNQRTLVREFYVDNVAWNVSTPDVAINTLPWQTVFWTPEVTLTVETIGAGYRLYLKKSWDLLNPDLDEIVDFDGGQGFGYDLDPYTWNLDAISGTELIFSQTGSLNTTGSLNSTQHNIQLWAYVTQEQMAGIYEGILDFIIEFDY